MSVTPATTIQILDEGVSQGRVKEIDFTGAGIAVSVSGKRAVVTASGGGGSGTDEVLLVPVGDKTIPANTSIVVGRRYFLGSGIQLAIASGANLTVI